ncbi:MAG: hypothetical protein HeimC2_22200 [Candidatus Heimdallarchaeota archaeon LC_2]|nr:MAG: hypothetical protein HeimC2_22200 [Candidatus Heimdallarchaeota archaeon LC_2]
MKFSKIGFLLILLLFFPNLNSQGEIDLQQENENEIIVIWVADSTIYADSFPVILASHDNVIANITFETSHMIYNTSSLLNGNGEIFWINVPNTQSGSDGLQIYSEEDLLGNYTFFWEKSDPFNNDPTSIAYSHHTFSYWSGQSTLTGVYYEDNRFLINYGLSTSELGQESAEPYNNDFDISGNYDFHSLMSAINISNAHKFQTWRYNGLIGICDGGGFSKELTIGFEERKLELEYIVDNDSCSSTRTVYSESTIGEIIDTLDSTTREIVNNANIQTQDEKLVNFQFWGFSFIVLIILKRIKKV